MLTNVNSLSRFANERSNVDVEIEISPNGEPPVGSSKTPLTRSGRISPVGVFSSSREPIASR
jgi:hypothetical protein